MLENLGDCQSILYIRLENPLDQIFCKNWEGSWKADDGIHDILLEDLLSGYLVLDGGMC